MKERSLEKYGATQVAFMAIWKIKSNTEIESLLENKNIIYSIKVSRLKCAGHVAPQMEVDRVQRRILNMNVGGKTKKRKTYEQIDG